MQKRKRGSSATASPPQADDSQTTKPAADTPILSPAVEEESPTEVVPVSKPPETESTKPDALPSSPPAIQLEPRRSLSYRNDIIHDVAPPKPLPSHGSRKLTLPTDLSDGSHHEDLPEKIEVTRRDVPVPPREHPVSPMSSLFKRSSHESHEAPKEEEPPKKEEIKPAEAAEQVEATKLREGSISDALAEDLGREKKLIEEQASEAAAKLGSSPLPEADDHQVAKEEIEAVPKTSEQPAKEPAGEPLDEPDRLLPEGPHSVASPSVAQVPREQAEHSVDLFDTTQYHTPLGSPIIPRGKKKSHTLMWVLITVIILALAALGAYYYFTMVKK